MSEQEMKKTAGSASRTKSIAFCGLGIALITVCAWITVPFGPVPFTLQTFAMTFVLLALKPREAAATIVLYVLIGAIGLPVFSSMKGGFAALAGPTGGFIWGFALGGIVSALLLAVFDKKGGKRPVPVEIAAAIVFLGVCYLCGWVQLVFVAQMGMAAAFAAAIAPFIIIDAVKLAVAIAVAHAVRKALSL